MFDVCICPLQQGNWTRARSMLAAGFAREWEPATILMFSAVERLVNERYVEDNEDGHGSSVGDRSRWCSLGHIRRI